MKYIDAEKLIAEIEDRLHCNGAFDEVGDYGWHYDKGMVDAYNHIKEFITSLQQEQPEKILTFGGFVDKVGTWFAHLRLDKFRETFDGETFPATELVQRYDWFVRELSKQYSDKQEQPEADLDFQVFAEEMDAVFNLPAEATENTEDNPLNWEYAIARHFYELGLNARKEETK